MKIFSSLLAALVALPISLSAQWDRQYPLEKLEQVLDIAVGNDGHGFAVGSNDLIQKLDPGTKQWDLLLSWNKKWKLEAVDYLSGTGGEFAAAGGNGFMFTENGGVNWTEIAGAPSGIKAVKFFPIRISSWWPLGVSSVGKIKYGKITLLLPPILKMVSF
jgi:photosystem II stability/assembly factor-like uncharacterized protein